MSDTAGNDNAALIEFWNRAFVLSSEERNPSVTEPEGWKDLAPSQKLFQAAASLGACGTILDYGCGEGWASIIAAKHGCRNVTAVDTASSAIEAAEIFADRYGVSQEISFSCISPDWLRSVKDCSYEGLFCSNVLDVIPSQTAEDLIREFVRVTVKNAPVIIGLNYYLSPETAAEKGLKLKDGNRLYLDGSRRMVSHTAEEWESLFSPYFITERLEHFAWSGEKAETRRLFYLRRR